MEWEGCNPSPECKYFPECYEDEHHPYRRAEFSDGNHALRSMFSRLYVVVGCREYHEQREADGTAWLEWPSDEVMRQEVDEAYVYISKSKRKKMGL